MPTVATKQTSYHDLRHYHGTEGTNFDKHMYTSHLAVPKLTCQVMMQANLNIDIFTCTFTLIENIYIRCGHSLSAGALLAIKHLPLEQRLVSNGPGGFT